MMIPVTVRYEFDSVATQQSLSKKSLEKYVKHLYNQVLEIVSIMIEI